MTSEVSEDAERASPANTHAHINDQRLPTDMKVKRYLLWCLSRAVKKKKKSSFHQKFAVVFCFFLLVPRSSLEKKKKANGPVECAQPAGCAQKGAAY